jgi:hypothetical protein
MDVIDPDALKEDPLAVRETRILVLVLVVK